MPSGARPRRGRSLLLRIPNDFQLYTFNMIQTRQIGSYTEIYSDKNGGGESATYFLTQSKATMFHDFWTRKLLAPGETPDDYIEVTVARKEQLEAARNAWTRPPKAFIDLWRSAFIVGTMPNDYNFTINQELLGDYNEETGYFEAYGELKDITYPQARDIILASFARPPLCLDGSTDYYLLPRTLAPISMRSENSGLYFKFHKAIEVLYFRSAGRITSIKNAFYQCWNLRKIKGAILGIDGVLQSDSNSFFQCRSLEDVRIRGGQGTTLNMKHCPKLSKFSIKYMIDNSPSFTLAVHADVMAKLTGDTTNAAAAALSAEELAEWMALVPLAAEKNIVFTA